jgi:hypothetical protein
MSTAFNSDRTVDIRQNERPHHRTSNIPRFRFPSHVFMALNKRGRCTSHGCRRGFNGGGPAALDVGARSVNCSI